MPLKILVIGPTGQIGSEIMLRLPTAVPIFRSKLDLKNPYRVAEALGGEKFDLLINAGGLVDLDYCEDHPDEADAINHRAVEEMAKFCVENNKFFIHISDGGFIHAGTSRDPFKLSDRLSDPINVYGNSKKLGDLSITEIYSSSRNPNNSITDKNTLRLSCRYCIVRASSVFGPALGRTNFLEKLISSSMRCKESVKVASWRLVSPTSAEEVARVVGELVDSLGEGGPNDGFQQPVVHVANAGAPASQAEVGAFALSQIPSLSHIKVVPVEKQGKSLPRVPPNTSVSPSEPSTPSPPLGLKSWKDAIKEYLLKKGYARPECALEIEADSEYSVTKAWEKLNKGIIPLDELVVGLRKDRLNWMAGIEGPGRKAKKGFWAKLGGEATEESPKTEE